MKDDNWEAVKYVVGMFILIWLVVFTVFGVLKLAGYLFDAPCSAFASKDEQRRCGL